MSLPLAELGVLHLDTLAAYSNCRGCTISKDYGQSPSSFLEVFMWSTSRTIRFCASLHEGQVEHSVRMDRIDKRLDRIENRLSLVDA